MTSFLDPLIAFVSAHAWLGYLTLFLAALLEAVPVVGAVRLALGRALTISVFAAETVTPPRVSKTLAVML